MDDSSSIAMEMPSTPTERLMFRGVNHCQLSQNSMGDSSPAARRSRYCTSSTTDSAVSTSEPTTATARICFMLRQRASPASISRGITTKYINIFENMTITMVYLVVSEYLLTAQDAYRCHGTK